MELTVYWTPSFSFPGVDITNGFSQGKVILGFLFRKFERENILLSYKWKKEQYRYIDKNFFNDTSEFNHMDAQS